MAQLLYRELSNGVLGACFAVHNALGPGLLESAYEGALVIELSARGLSFERQVVYPLTYRGELAGAYICFLSSKIPGNYHVGVRKISREIPGFYHRQTAGGFSP
ncbi:MAG: GxxExxY protein [Spirochaetales bacterium]|nr:GxxExxY protein [Spirochaetales bacterium]MCF7938776.1 GxxExxY protein [Spirochaetales bacterium]